MKTLYSVSLLILINVSVTAQHAGSWWMYFGNYRLHDHWSLWTEAQYRSHDYGQNIEQLLLRTAINYHFSKNSTLSIGYGYIGNYLLDVDIESPNIEEGRIYEQYVHKHVLPHIIFEHRFRVEQRWAGNFYKNRVRYRLFLTLPLNKKHIEQKTLFLGIYDEIFLNTVEKYFDRNRFYIALGYQINESMNVQSGMLNQRVKDFDKWYFQLALTWTPDFKKQK